ncbi:rubrerythrin-like domain-containing protein [Halobellus ordinarius]|nr:rubrerythrin-like domain-containing protein [Halobellus sp. ZY16]
MRDVDPKSAEETPYECFDCGTIIVAETSPSQCPDCGGPMRNRRIQLE